MKNEKFKENKFMMFSNVFLALPVIFAAIYGEWLYCFFASGLLVFSPLFHWYRIINIGSFWFKLFKAMDWMFAIGAFFYMYYYILMNTYFQEKTFLIVALTCVVIFFWYGWKKADYEKLHPWFHIVAPVISSLILIVAR